MTRIVAVTLNTMVGNVTFEPSHLTNDLTHDQNGTDVISVNVEFFFFPGFSLGCVQMLQAIFFP